MSKLYKEVGGEALEALGVKDVLRTPADGVDRNPWIIWNTARLAVAAGFERAPNGLVPAHEIVLQNADGQGNSLAIGTGEREDGTVWVVTVSGGETDLSEEQTATFKALVETSIAEGLRYPSR